MLRIHHKRTRSTILKCWIELILIYYTFWALHYVMLWTVKIFGLTLILIWALLNSHYYNLRFMKEKTKWLKNTPWKAVTTRHMLQEMEGIKPQIRSWTATYSPDSGWFLSTQTPWDAFSGLCWYLGVPWTPQCLPGYPNSHPDTQSSFQKGSDNVAEKRDRRDGTHFS